MWQVYQRSCSSSLPELPCIAQSCRVSVFNCDTAKGVWMAMTELQMDSRLYRPTVPRIWTASASSMMSGVGRLRPRPLALACTPTQQSPLCPPLLNLSWVLGRGLCSGYNAAKRRAVSRTACSEHCLLRRVLSHSAELPGDAPPPDVSYHD